MTNQTKNNNLNHLIDPTFTEVNRLFVSLTESEEYRFEQANRIRKSWSKITN